MPLRLVVRILRFLEVPLGAYGDCGGCKPEGRIDMRYCTNPACSHALIGVYITWFVGGGGDLQALLLGAKVSRRKWPH